MVDDRYVLSGLLGGGGMGRVYLACDEVLERDVALKVSRERYAGDEGFVERFEREARTAAALNHPHIVSVYDRKEVPSETAPAGIIVGQNPRAGSAASAGAPVFLSTSTGRAGTPASVVSSVSAIASPSPAATAPP